MNFSSLSPSSVLQILWACYVENLWSYKPNSVVAKAAYSFKVLALALLLPILILILLDITSYTIARTLGVVDIVKASTSDKQTMYPRREPPSIHIREASVDRSNEDSAQKTKVNLRSHFFTLDSDSSQSIAVLDSLSAPSDVRLTEYFTSEDNNLELSGVGVFSPATSRPPSPTTSRRKLEPEIHSTLSLHEFEIDDGSAHFRKRNTPLAALESIRQ
ncbi:hypothetical protein C8J55DRAFT_95508 [Lentinula edodes]|uniref:Uncharacterized protein n=1 Tax=Lentinula lateritia TaxID=40482 RepID=A0A9W9A8J8_9AGAR|nr:hypothetical protein C8J55DRAFT_95508 [Lentinula edodes]